jgi:cation diffusion facilitator family transporter
MRSAEMRESKTAIIAALTGNLAIAVVKLIAAFITGSSAMTSEAIHSLVDTGNEVLLLLGMSRSKRLPDLDHPYGHGRELYFWSFVVAVAIFAVGGGVSIYEGIGHLLAPTVIEDPFWNYVVLAIAFVFEGISWLFGWRAFRKQLGNQGPLAAIHRSKDPTVFIVVFEDSAALVGLAIAFLGVFFGHLWSNPYLDGAASVLIGLMLALMSAFLAYETKGLLIGEGYDRKTLQELRQAIASDQAIARVNRLLTLFFGPDDVMLTVEVTFRDRTTVEEIREAAKRIREKVKAQHSEITRIYFASENMIDESGQDSLEPHGATD